MSHPTNPQHPPRRPRDGALRGADALAEAAPARHPRAGSCLTGGGCRAADSPWTGVSPCRSCWPGWCSPSRWSSLSRAVEGARKSKDRLATTLVTTAFVVALLPLVSLLWQVFSKGAPVVSSTFLTSSMRNVVGEGGGDLPRDLGDDPGHRSGHHHVGADRAADRDLPRRVRRWSAGQGDHLPGRRDDRDPVDRRRALRLRTVRHLLRSGSADGLRRRRRAVPPDGPAGGPLRRGDAEAGPARPAGGGVRARRAQVANHPQGRASDIARGHRDRSHDRDGPRDRRDRAAADHLRRDGLDELQPVQRTHDDAAGLHLRAVQEPWPSRVRERTTGRGGLHSSSRSS